MDELLQQAILSGQVSAAQIEAHDRAGEVYPPDLFGRREPTPVGEIKVPVGRNELRFYPTDLVGGEPPKPARLTYNDFCTIRIRTGYAWLELAQAVEAEVLRKNGLL